MTSPARANMPSLTGVASGGGAAAGGASVFGSRLPQIPVTNPFTDLSKVYPNLSGTNAATSGAIMSRLQGQLSPETMATIQNAAAQFGVGSGMPGSGLQANRTVRDLGIASENLQQQGIQDYNATIPTVSSTQTLNPQFQFEAALQNAVNAASPDPAAAGSYAQSLFDKYLQQLSSPAGGGGGGGPQVPWYDQGINASAYAPFNYNRSWIELAR